MSLAVPLATAPRRSGTIAAVLLTLAAVIAVTATWVSEPVAAGAMLCVAVIAAALSVRWPAQMLTLAAFSTLTDPYLIHAVTGPVTGHTLWYSSDVALLVVGLPITARALLERRLIPALRHPATPFFAAYTAVAVISALVNGVPPVVAAAGIGVTLDGIAIFYLVRMIGPDERFLKRVIGIFVAIMVLAGLLAIGQVLLAPDLLGFRAFAGDFGEGGRATAFLGNPNQLAPLLALAMPFPLLVLPDAARRRDRVLLLAVSLVLAIAFWLTFSRAAWTAFVLALLVVAIRFDRRGLVLAVTVGVLALATAMAMPRNLAVQGQANYANLQDPDVFDATFGRLGAIGAGSDLRVIFLEEGLPIAAQNPVIGVGPGRYGGAAANVFGTPVYARYGISLHGFHTVHDYWLHLLVEVGVLGAGAVLVAMILVARRLWRAAVRISGQERAILLALLIGIVAVSINSLAEMLLEGNSPSFVLWLLLGLGSLLADGALSEPA